MLANPYADWINKLHDPLTDGLYPNFLSTRARIQARFSHMEKYVGSSEEFANELITVLIRFGCYKQLLQLSVTMNPLLRISKLQTFGALEIFKLTQSELRRPHPKQCPCCMPSIDYALFTIEQHTINGQTTAALENYIFDMYLKFYSRSTIEPSWLYNFDYLMAFYGDVIRSKLSQTGQITKTIQNLWSYRKFMITRYKKEKQVKSLTYNEFAIEARKQIGSIGGKYLENLGAKTFVNVLKGSAPANLLNAHVPYILGQYFRIKLKNYGSARMCYFVAVITFSDLYPRALSMKGFALNCYRNKEYLMGLRVLRCAYQCCNGHILPSFVHEFYPKQRRKFEKKLKAIKCSHCSAPYDKSFKCCSGCMGELYCSRSCQKKHWKKQHRNECNGQWRMGVGLYMKLKKDIFAKML